MKHAITLTTLLMVSSDLFAGFRNVNELDSCLVTVRPSSPWRRILL